MPSRSVAELEVALTDLYVSYLAEISKDRRNALLKELAAATVDLREHYKLADGKRTDWAGRSPGYRASMKRVYEAAEVPEVEKVRISGALRWHTGEELRNRASAEELAEVGLSSTKPKERLQKTRDALKAMAEDATPQADIPRLAAYAQALLEYADETAIRSLTPAECVAARTALEAILHRSDQLLSVLDTAETKPQAVRRPQSV
ncbi:hypothetical protein JNUCC0626_18270 [Lentzea sp. JNUCC 0626]|uniref:hypothetical protein n=1 Tax=Lentzea sp. JNUCC 0626 TaxID=3367513 RepID=UPI0037487441